MGREKTKFTGISRSHRYSDEWQEGAFTPAGHFSRFEELSENLEEKLEKSEGTLGDLGDNNLQMKSLPRRLYSEHRKQSLRMLCNEDQGE